MIVVGKPEDVGDAWRVCHIDKDRSISVGRGAQGVFVFVFDNGGKLSNLSLTEEGANALHLLLDEELFGAIR